MQDRKQFEALSTENEFEDEQSFVRRSSPFRLPVMRLVAIVGAFAAVVCIGAYAQSRAHVHFGAHTDGVTMLIDSSKCAWGRMNCNDTKCCGAAGMQCYEQGKYYAQCSQSCTPDAPVPTHWDSNPWSCKELGSRTPGEPLVCPKHGEDCRKTRCCSEPGFQCYEKNSSFATCKRACAANGPDLSDTDGSFWSCKELGERAPETQPWVRKQCAKEGESCLDKKCCMNEGDACFLQNEYWGTCKSACNPDQEQGWDCTQVGPVTPATLSDGAGKLAPWVFTQCSKPQEACLDTGCCVGMDYQCYKKNQFWATCMRSCEESVHPGDSDNESWSCETVGSRSAGLATKGSPALYCWSVISVQGYEKDLYEAVHEKGASIFACDGHAMLTADTTTEIGGETTTKFNGAPVISSVDGTAGNTQLFVNAWNKVIELGKWEDYAFIVKVDPDAVFIPEKLRWHLGSHVFETMYVINCQAWNMIYGSLEIFSYHAIRAWKDGHEGCNAPPDFGEDKYMTQCMDHLGVTRVDDFGVVGDMLCGSFTDCRSLPAAAFHPFKDKNSWLECWQTAMYVLG